MEKIAPANSPQQRKLENFDSIEEDRTDVYDSDRDLGPIFDVNEEESEQDFDEDSRPVSRSMLVEEYEGKSTTATPEYETPCHVPTEDAVLEKIKVSEIQEIQIRGRSG